MVENSYSEVGDGEGECANDEADDGVENGFLGLFDFAWVAGRSHIMDATDYDKDYGDDADTTNDGVENVGDGVWKLFAVSSTAVGGFDIVRSIRTADISSDGGVSRGGR